MFTQEHQDLIDRYKVVMEFYGGDNILIKKILKTGRIVKSDIKREDEEMQILAHRTQHVGNHRLHHHE